MGFNLTSFVFETINFLVLVWLLQRLVYRPLQKGIAERKAAIEAREQSLQDDRAHLAELRSSVEQQQSELGTLRERTLREATESAEEQRARLLEQAKQDAARERARVLSVLAAEREKALIWVREMALEQGAEVAGKLLVELSQASLDQALQQRLLDQLGEHRSAFEDTPGEQLRARVTSASPLNEQALATLANRLEAIAGRPLTLSADVDARLLRGLVLELGSRQFDASLAGQLELVTARARKHLKQEAAVA